MIFKIMRDIFIMVVLLIAMIKIGTAQEIREGGIRLKNGCYTLLIVDEGDHGKRLITVQDCRGGRKIWKKLV